MTAESFPMEDDFLDSKSFLRRYRCCSLWNFPRKSDWERIPRSEVVELRSAGGSWWRNKIKDLKAAMKWPDWMQFIWKASSDRSKANKFGYDPMSYAMNFDEGSGQSNEINEGWESLRNAAIDVDEKEPKAVVTSG